MLQGFYYAVHVTSGQFMLPEDIEGVLLLDFSDGPNRIVCFASPELVEQKIRTANPLCELNVTRVTGVRHQTIEAAMQAAASRIQQKVSEIAAQSAAEVIAEE
jgi:hypothetical protein